jgi:ribosomal protein S18 acetylase RimI-like enzyme
MARAETGAVMPADYRRAFAAMRRTELRGTREEPFRFGTALFTPELPLRHDSNLLYADTLPDDVDADEVAREADAVQGAAGLGHRVVLVPDESAARLADGFRALGWDAHPYVVMALRRPPERPVDTSRVVEVDEARLRPFREAFTRTYPWGSPEVARQLAEAKRLIRGTTRFFAVIEDGEVVACTDLYLDGGDAEIEDVATLPAHRGRGFASALVVRACEEARRARADLVFLVADDQDWPKELYRRLGFDELGRYWKFSRSPTRP